MAEPKVVLELAGHEVAISNPSKVFFPRAGVTKLDMVRYYLAVAPGALGGVRGRPMALKRFVNGAESEPFFQKRAPDKRPDWLGTVELRFPSGRTADEVTTTWAPCTRPAACPSLKRAPNRTRRSVTGLAFRSEPDTVSGSALSGFVMKGSSSSGCSLSPSPSSGNRRSCTAVR